MRAVALIAACTIGLCAVPAAKAEIYTFTDWGPGFGSWHYDPGQPRGSASVVAGWGDDLSQDQRRYWGGPFFVDKRGYHPPYQSYGFAGHRYCQSVMLANADGSQRPVKSCR
jgi:hypothetical protein